MHLFRSIALLAGGLCLAPAALAQPEATDLGTLANPSVLQTSVTFPGSPAGFVQWYRFTIPDIAAPAYLDIRTLPVDGATSIDTEIGLFLPDAFDPSISTLVVSDDDDGAGLFSAASFGQACPTRPNPAIGTNAAGVAFNGRDGAFLAAGTYYLAVTGFNATFAANYSVTGTHTRTGDVGIEIVLNTATDVQPTLSAMTVTPAVNEALGVSLVTATLAPCSPDGFIGANVTLDLSPLGGSTTAQMFDDGTNGDLNPGDNIWSLNITVPDGTPAGAYTLTATATNAAMLSNSRTATLTVIVNAPLNSVKISQFDGAGSLQGASGPNVDFIELYNAGQSPADMTGYSLQIAAAAGTTWQRADFPAGTIIPPGGYYLVQCGNPGATGVAIPQPDLVATNMTNLVSTGGKIALVRNQGTLTGACPLGPAVSDFVGSGTGANCREGSTNAPSTGTAAPARTIVRGCNGATDTDENGSDFALGVFAFETVRNSSSTAAPGGPAVTATTISPATIDSGEMVNITATVASCGASGIAVTADLSPYGGLAAHPLLDDGNNGDGFPGDGVYGAFATLTAGPGAGTITLTAVDSQSRSSTGSVTFLVNAPAFDIRISAANGAGGLQGASGPNADYVELHNAGSTIADLTGYSVQLATATGTAWSRIDLPVGATIQPNGYYLVQTMTSAATGFPLFPDHIGAFNTLGSTGGKVAIVRNQATLPTGACPLPNPAIMDFLGFGNANCFEGSAPAPSHGTAAPPRSVVRLCGGAVDSGDNAQDFLLLGATPESIRNSGSAPNAADTLFLVGTALAPAAVLPGSTTLLTVGLGACGAVPANPAISVDLAALGGSSNTPMVDDGTNGDQFAGDGIYSINITPAILITPGAYTLAINASDALGRTASTSITLTVQQPVRGACCVGAACNLQGELQCIALGGTWQGAGSGCVAYAGSMLGTTPIDDISATGFPLTLTDDSGSTQDLGFTFNYFGNEYTSVWVCSNGFVQFGGTNNTTFTNTAIPATGVPNNAVYVCWDDYNPAVSGTVYVQADGVAPNRRFIAQWNAITQFNTTPADSNTFQVILYEGSNVIEFRYGLLTDIASRPGGAADVTVGVENEDGTVAYSIDSLSLGSGFVSLTWTPAGSPCAPTCRADLNNDGVLDPDDLADAIGCFFGTECTIDYNNDGTEDPDDLADYIAEYFDLSNACPR